MNKNSAKGGITPAGCQSHYSLKCRSRSVGHHGNLKSMPSKITMQGLTHCQAIIAAKKHDTVKSGWSILYFEGSQVIFFLNSMVFMFFLSNRTEDPDVVGCH